MDYPFISRNNQPIAPGTTVTYRSRRYGDVFGEVTQCVIKRKRTWEGGKDYVYLGPTVRIRVHVTKTDSPYHTGYVASLNPGNVVAII